MTFTFTDTDTEDQKYRVLDIVEMGHNVNSSENSTMEQTEKNQKAVTPIGKLSSATADGKETYTLTGNVSSGMESFESAVQSQGSGKWVGLLIAAKVPTDQKLCWKGTDGQYTEQKIESYDQWEKDLNNSSADGEQYLVLWVKANQMSSSENTKKECGIKIGSQADSATETLFDIVFQDSGSTN